VRAWLDAAQVRGWKFQPVLEQGGALHRDHSQRWDEILGRLREAGASVVA
jgi:hypothetical protein